MWVSVPRFGLGRVDACCQLIAVMSGHSVVSCRSPETPAHTSCSPAVPLLGMHPIEMCRSAHWEPCHSHGSTLCNSRNQRLSRSPSTGQGKQTVGHSHLVSSGLWGRTRQPRAVAWMSLPGKRPRKEVSLSVYTAKPTATVHAWTQTAKMLALPGREQTYSLVLAHLAQR